MICLCNSTKKRRSFTFSANYPQWIPYAIIGSTAISLPLVGLVQEEYNRSALDVMEHEAPLESNDDDNESN